MSERSAKGVLVVEDERELLGLFVYLLETERFTVFQSVDGQQAVSILESHLEEIDLIVTDLGLPKVGGVDLIARAKALKPSIKIIGTSGLGGQSVRTLVLEAGADVFFPKPFKLSEVMETIMSIMA